MLQLDRLNHDLAPFQNVPMGMVKSFGNAQWSWVTQDTSGWKNKPVVKITNCQTFKKDPKHNDSETWNMQNPQQIHTGTNLSRQTAPKIFSPNSGVFFSLGLVCSPNLSSCQLLSDFFLPRHHQRWWHRHHHQQRRSMVGRHLCLFSEGKSGPSDGELAGKPRHFCSFFS